MDTAEKLAGPGEPMTSSFSQATTPGVHATECEGVTPNNHAQANGESGASGGVMEAQAGNTAHNNEKNEPAGNNLDPPASNSNHGETDISGSEEPQQPLEQSGEGDPQAAATSQVSTVMAGMDPFALLIQMSDRLIDESYKAAEAKAESANSQKRLRSHQSDTDKAEPQSKMQKTEGAACSSYNTKRQTIVYENDFHRSPLKIAESWGEFNNSHKENFLKGCKWSPDGTCILTCSNDNALRIFNLPEELYCGRITSIPEMCAVLQMQEAECIYDYAWYPRMSSNDPTSCCLVSTSRNTPIHMWDAFTGSLRCSYRAFGQADELSAAYSVGFSRDGSKLYCGFNKCIRIFDVDRPGRTCQTRPTYHKQGQIGQTGIISCFAMNPSDASMYAAGSYSRSIGLYSEGDGTMISMFEGQQGGVTHILFSPDGNRLYSGGRKDPEILCWDLRNPGHILHTMSRQVATNQRIYFDIDSTGRYVMSGSHDGSVLVWDTHEPPQTSEDADPFLNPIRPYKAHEDTVNGISLHPSMPILATASGQRHFEVHDMESSGEEEEDDDDVEEGDNSLRLWWIGN